MTLVPSVIVPFPPDRAPVKVMLKLLVLNVPLLHCRLAHDIAFDRLQPPVLFMKIVDSNVTPLVAIVLPAVVEKKFSCPV